jgi:hypothetical protein
VDDLSLVETIDCFCQGIVIAVADAAHGGFKAGLGEALGVFDRYVLSGLKRSSQQPEKEVADEASEAAFGSSWPRAIALAGPTLGGRAT